MKYSWLEISLILLVCFIIRYILFQIKIEKHKQAIEQHIEYLRNRKPEDM